jgi:hypothetical protein
MTAKKKTARKKSTRRKTARKSRPNAKSLLHAADRELAQLSNRFETQLALVGRETQPPPPHPGREAAKLLRQARAKLDKMQVRGSSEWDKFLRKSKRDLSQTLGKLEKTVSPKPKSKKKTAKKKTATKSTAKKSTAKKKSSTKKPARKRAS